MSFYRALFRATREYHEQLRQLKMWREEAALRSKIEAGLISSLDSAHAHAELARRNYKEVRKEVRTAYMIIQIIRFTGWFTSLIKRKPSKLPRGVIRIVATQVPPPNYREEAQ